MAARCKVKSSQVPHPRSHAGAWEREQDNMEDLFGEGKVIRIETKYGDTVERYIRFLKVKDLPEFFRIDAMENEVERMAALIAMIKQRVRGEIRSLPGDDLRDAFMDMNFGSAPTSLIPKESVGGDTLHNLISSFDFLISQGHSFSAIMEYTVPRYRHLMEAACNRVFGKKEKPKKTDWLDTFTKMGIPVERRK